MKLKIALAVVILLFCGWIYILDRPPLPYFFPSKEMTIFLANLDKAVAEKRKDIPLTELAAFPWQRVCWWDYNTPDYEGEMKKVLGIGSFVFERWVYDAENVETLFFQNDKERPVVVYINQTTRHDGGYVNVVADGKQWGAPCYDKTDEPLLQIK